MGVEQRQLLVAVHDIAGVVDIQNDRDRLAFVRRHPLIDKRVGEADRVLQRRRVLQPRQRRLRTQVRAAFRQTPAGELERRIGAQTIQIVGIFIAARDRKDARADHVGERMGDPRRIATIGKTARQSLGDAKPPFGHREQHHAAIRGEPSAIESSCDLLARNGWKRERREIIVGHGERGGRGKARGLASATKSYALSTHYATLASLKPRHRE